MFSPIYFSLLPNPKAPSLSWPSVFLFSSLQLLDESDLVQTCPEQAKGALTEGYVSWTGVRGLEFPHVRELFISY